MDISHDHTDFGPQMGHMTYFIFEPPSAQPRDPADSKFFWAKNTQHQITKYSAFLDY
jgi:hypothetical protein